MAIVYIVEIGGHDHCNDRAFLNKKLAEKHYEWRLKAKLSPVMSVIEIDLTPDDKVDEVSYET